MGSGAPLDAGLAERRWRQTTARARKLDDALNPTVSTARLVAKPRLAAPAR
jgi:hypothetical protein